MLFQAKVTKSGKIKLQDKNSFDLCLDQLRGFPITLQVFKSSKKRSSQQNAYFHGVILPMVWRTFVDYGVTNEAGVKPTELDVKEFLKSLFLEKEIKDNQGNELGKYIKHTSELTTSEAEDFFERIRQWAAKNFSLEIPLPNEGKVDRDTFK